MRTSLWTSLALTLSLLLISGAAHARQRHHRHHGVRQELKNALWALHPGSQVESNKCDIKIDCKHYSVTVNGKSAGQIICGSQTGWNFKNKKVTLGRSVTPAAGNILPKGFPMLATNPPLCNNCYIHVYHHVGPKAKSLGCVGIEKRAWDAITKCGGSQIAFTTVNGIQSADPDEVMSAANDEKLSTLQPAAPIKRYSSLETETTTGSTSLVSESMIEDGSSR